MPLVSIIVPVYNTEKYLIKCLDSLLAQTLHDIEILLIDDGSTDSSGMICDNYAHQDKRLQVFHIPNQGVSHARNKGLEIAEGEYILFVDSDDWINNDMIRTLYQLIQSYQTDLSTCGYIIEDEKGHVIYQIEQQIMCILDKWDAIHSLFQDKYYKYKGNLWDKLFKRTIIDNHHLRFNEDIYYNEDRLFIFQYLNHCQSISYITIPHYHYVMRESSAMNTFQNSYNEKLATFMNAFDIMTSMSATYPNRIKRALSIDYIKTSISFFKKYACYISLIEIWEKIIKIKRNNFNSLSILQQIKYMSHYIKVLICIKLKLI